VEWAGIIRSVFFLHCNVALDPTVEAVMNSQRCPAKAIHLGANSVGTTLSINGVLSALDPQVVDESETKLSANHTTLRGCQKYSGAFPPGAV
jgi:hypothetical protein